MTEQMVDIRPVEGPPIKQFVDSKLMESVRAATSLVPPGEHGYWMLNAEIPEKEVKAIFVEKVGEHVSIVFTSKYHWGPQKDFGLGVTVAGTF